MSSLLLDLGGSYIKTATVSAGSFQLENVTRWPMPELQTENLQRRVLRVKQLRPLIDLAVNEALRLDQTIRRIFISGQMGCWFLAAVDTQPDWIVSWQDLRSLEQFASLDEAIQFFDLPNLITANGNEIGLGVPVVGLLCELRNHERLDVPLRFGTLLSWCADFLTATSSSVIHVTDAASTGLLDLEKRDWHHLITGGLKVPISWPRICCEVVPVGTLEGTDIEVFCGVGDQQASLLGANLSSDRLIVNIGTGGQVAALGVSKLHERVKRRPFFNEELISTVTHLPSGRYLKEALRLGTLSWGSEISFAQLDNLQESYLGQDNAITIDMLRDLAFVVRYAQTNSIDEFLNLFVDLMAREYIEAINRLIKPEHSEIRFAGGVGQKCSPLTMRIASSFQGLKSSIATVQETTLAGLADFHT